MSAVLGLKPEMEQCFAVLPQLETLLWSQRLPFGPKLFDNTVWIRNDHFPHSLCIERAILAAVLEVSRCGLLHCGQVSE